MPEPLFPIRIATAVGVGLFGGFADAWTGPTTGTVRRSSPSQPRALSDKYLENDLVAVQPPPGKDGEGLGPRLCVVRPEGAVAPLCQHEEDVETDLFVDPRCETDAFWRTDLVDGDVRGTYGEGWYGQRPVPSLGGGPGYGAEAQEIWSIDEGVLEEILGEQVDLPLLDVGIAHGEKARGGAF